MKPDTEKLSRDCWSVTSADFAGKRNRVCPPCFDFFISVPALRKCFYYTYFPTDYEGTLGVPINACYYDFNSYYRSERTKAPVIEGKEIFRRVFVSKNEIQTEALPRNEKATLFD